MDLSFDLAVQDWRSLVENATTKIPFELSRVRNHRHCKLDDKNIIKIILRVLEVSSVAGEAILYEGYIDS